jgi:glutathione S-transferase
MMFFAINSLLNGSRKDAGYNIGPAARKWFETISARPALQKAMGRMKQEEDAARAKI